MKFVCDRCQTRYSIADEKVRQKILRIRCKTCGNVIVVQEQAARSGSDEHPGGAKAATASGPKVAPQAEARPAGGPPPLPPRGGKGKGHDKLGGRAEWFVAIDGVRSGPMSRVEAARRIVAVGAGKEIHVWKEGMANWKPPREVSVIARELSLLRPAAPPPPPGVAPAARPPAPAEAHDAGPGHPPPTQAARPPGAPVAKVVDDLFGDVTTQKMDGMEDLVAATADRGFEEVTTKKGKNLRVVENESESLFESNPTVIDSEATPPPVEPLPPVGAKPRPSTPPAPSLPFGAKAAPGTPAVPPRPPISLTPPPALSRAPVPALPAPGVPAHAAAPPFVAPATRPAPPFVAPALAPLSPGRATPLAPQPVRVTPLAPLMAPGTPLPPGMPPAPSPLPTPQPVAPLGVDLGPVVSLDFPMATSAPAGVLQRRPGLKYVMAALAIVVVVILLGLVILRSTRDKLDDATPVGVSGPAKTEPPKVAPAEPAKTELAEPAKVEPAKVELAKVEPAKAEPAKVEPAKEPKLAMGESPKAAPGRHGGKRAGRTPVSPIERTPKVKPESNPPRLAGSRPNPFDEGKGAVSQTQIMAVVKNPANQAALKSCYERALKMDNHLTSGRMDVTVNISTSGAVERVVVNAPSGFILVEPCIKGVVKRWRFPSNTEDYATNFPLIMQGGM
jgi:predicted Zn finger-like uncharacterized protein